MFILEFLIILIFGFIITFILSLNHFVTTLNFQKDNMYNKMNNIEVVKMLRTNEKPTDDVFNNLKAVDQFNILNDDNKTNVITLDINHMD